MRAFLEFDLNESEDKYEFRRATNATKAYLSLFDISNACGRVINGDSENAEALRLAEEIITIINDRVDMDDLE